MSEEYDGEYTAEELARVREVRDRIFENMGFTSPFVDPSDKRLIAPHIKAALDKWNAGQSYPTGDFLRAVLTNNLTEAFATGDEYNLKTLHAIVSYVYNELLFDNHGSVEKYYAWIKLHQEIERNADAALPVDTVDEDGGSDA